MENLTHDELMSLTENLMNAAEGLISYFRYHNKNLTKAQHYKIIDFAEIAKKTEEKINV